MGHRECVGIMLLGCYTDGGLGGAGEQESAIRLLSMTKFNLYPECY